jgi:23S rRNA (guanosine2251-2'-O)-methyltransferase
LLEVLKASAGRVGKIYIQKDGGPRRLREVVRLARAAGVPFVFVPKERLDQLASHHQGLVADVSAKTFTVIGDILAGAGPLFLVLLDEVEDPQNLGAVVRSAAAAGADGLVLPERRSAGLTEAVATVAAGALEHLKIARVTNLARTISLLKERGLWIVGAAASAPEPWHAFDYTQPVAIVLGSEGRGLRPVVRTACDKLLSIPLRPAVESLNVAAAGAVFFFEVVRQRIEAGRKNGPRGQP